ncbi:MAG: M1 family aminopeptidase [Myxococcota bacterium]
MSPTRLACHGPVLALLTLSALAGAGCASSPPRVGPPVPAPVAADPDRTMPGLRLPRDVRPLGYALDLAVTPGEPRFGGSIAITIELDRPRRIIWLHGDGLHVTAASIDDRPVVYTEADDDEGLASVSVAADAPPIPAGRAVLRFSYDAPVSHGGDSVFDVEEEQRHYILTTFEPISARLAWPCFDEPGFKVPWELTLTIPAGDVALSSAPELSSSAADPTHTRVRFAPSAPLPTYLFSFAVGPFDVVAAPPLAPNALRPTPLPIRGVAVHGKGPELARQLAEVGPLLQALEQWFGRAYPYAKLDVVATPGYPGAMENAALVLFDEYALFVSPTRASRDQLQGAENTLAHELSHQWFGDLVTMAWWDDLWLNEAFATWMANRIVQEVRPDLMAETHRLSEWRQAMGADAKASARRIRQPIASHHDMLAAFDAITYQKGASIIAMMEQWAGPAAWQAGVRAYLGDHAYANATTDELLAAVAARAPADRPIVEPFKSFLDATGAPQIGIDVGAPVDGKLPVTFHVARLRPVGSHADPGGGWRIPVCMAGPGLADDGSACVLVTAAEQTALVPFQGARPTALAPNAGGLGYYQAVVRPEALLRAALAAPRSPAEAAATAASYTSAFETGLLSTDEVLAALAPLASSPEPEQALAPLRLLTWVAERVASDADRPALRKKARALFGKSLAALGWEARAGSAESGSTELLRAALIDFMARVVRDPAVRKEAARRGRAFLGMDGATHPDAVAPDLLPTALVVALEDADPAFFEVALATLHRSQDPALRGILLAALAAVTDPALAERVRALTLDPALTDTEMLQPLKRQLDDRRLQADAWRYLRDHWDAVLERMPPFSLGFVPELVDGFCDPAARADVAAFLGPRVEPLSGAPHALAESLETIDLCIALVERQGPSARSWLSR